MTVYELIQELTNYNADDKVEFNVELKDFEICENMEELKDMAKDGDDGICIDIDVDVDFYDTKCRKSYSWREDQIVTILLQL